jgi:hypothetical protein
VRGVRGVRVLCFHLCLTPHDVVRCNELQTWLTWTSLWGANGQRTSLLTWALSCNMFMW